ncbi:MAG: septal ring lytic transglycosylase RlpA family protein, partial [Cyanobacteria bacterium M_surface_7_m2_040]|nr:septal ring lytic transglycosylase RlpA family protein [Cyanobacteria bacterium M_surface_7_m2_040]
MNAESVAAISNELAIREATDSTTLDQPKQPELPLPVSPEPQAQPRVLAIKTGQASWYGP